MEKHKIINDPVYGFIHVPAGLVFEIIEHPYFQRLRRIKQLGMTEYVYPGALHTRFHHALGSMHLMRLCLNHLRERDVSISDEEFEGALIAILLHDIGHGPYSHALEFTLLQGVAHEELSLVLMEDLNRQFDGRLGLAIDVFTDRYSRPFFHQLVSSQLDVDRLDYLQRDSFYTGVHEGTIGADRIIKMMNVHDGQLVIEEKGIYSIENFLIARRLMYWQVYLHHASVSAEAMLISVINRARELARRGIALGVTPALEFFFKQSAGWKNGGDGKDFLKSFIAIDDFDIFASVKAWMMHPDRVLSVLSSMLVNRRLFRVEIYKEPFSEDKRAQIETETKKALGLSNDELEYFIRQGEISNKAYVSNGQRINILSKRGSLHDIREVSDLSNIATLAKIVKKHYLCWPKIVSL
ncbi:MAG: HD domain-containing protein [Cytophagales bacterium]|nr:HD domain-containing protein [Cytophagales bacterium]